MAGLTLRCYVWGEPPNRFFDVEVQDEVYGADLRETIRKEKGFPADRVLILFKVSISPRKVRPGLRAHGTPCDIDGARTLISQHKLKDIFKLDDPLNPEEIHVSFKPLPVLRAVLTPSTRLSIEFYPRTELVEALYNKLEEERFVQVRAPPASGKKALSQLLAAYIEKEEPGAAITYIPDWHQDQVEGYANGFYDWLELHQWDYPGVTSVLFINAAESSYWDKKFWNQYMTKFNQKSRPRVIMFASYGSPVSDPQSNPTPPMRINDISRVSLHRVDDELGRVGLLLTLKEFDEYIQHSRPGHTFDKSFLQLVYRVTGGYIGMVNILLDMVQGHKSYTHPATQGKGYTLADFTERISISEFFKALLATLVLSVVLETASIHGFVTLGMLTTADAKDALQLCFERAWLHADLLHGEVRYSFPSPLHRRCVQAQFWGLADQADAQVVEETLPEFAFNVLKLFLLRNFPIELTVIVASTGIQRDRDPVYGELFYRYCCLHAGGAVVTPPEFGSTTESKINLFIPQKRWGVELLCNGEHLDEYVSSFSTSGEYGAWIEREGDYIILDFCNEVPSKPHPGVSNLYHIVINKDSVGILDNDLRPAVDHFCPKHG
ncbi:hypothetical protein BDN72DRAFT_893968 [Pluteus cervinus]|uniref:Uncharacterized protein n=1 Tax=Pluteus cervinus TaxID=181527 RepID=A0ACD3B6W2_9AGAR|nr:hypothetical protein BDN72DRAFT_893968 [Pluteus cervinus]